MKHYSSHFQNMATSDKEFESNLSEELPSKEKESETISYEEKDAVIWNENGAKTCSSDDNVDRNKASCLAKNDQEFMDQSNNGGLNTEGNVDYDISSSVSESVESEKPSCSDTGRYSVEVEKVAELNKNSPPLARSSGRKVDEALLEEDEMGCSGDEEEHYESAEEEHLTPEEAEERMEEALELKKEGNDHFRKQEYFEGKDLYTKALKRCPKEFTENKSIFYANRAACFQKLEDYENAISDCSAALELAPNYFKARLRRAQCYEKVEKQEEALEDYKIVFENDKSCQPAREAILRLPEEIKIKHEKLKEEMIGKLKDLGNMVLRPFGLSTDNFNLQQDPNSGGYSINFQK